MENVIQLLGFAVLILGMVVEGVAYCWYFGSLVWDEVPGAPDGRIVSARLGMILGMAITLLGGLLLSR